MKKGFTLIELLLVVAIMGLLGTAAVGGYRQMQRGMEERGVMQNVNSFIRAAYQRSRIDRQPTAIYFWNETLRVQSEEQNEIVVGHAVAVRRSGRITKVKGDLLIDEFADLNLAYPTEKTDNPASMRLYQLDVTSGDSGLAYSLVKDHVEMTTTREIYLTHDATKDPDLSDDDEDEDEDSVDLTPGEIAFYGFAVEKKGSATWKVGTPYGFEFASITLPHGYIFGSSYSSSSQSPVQDIGTIIFKDTSGGKSIEVSAIRPGSGGALTVESIGKSDSPTKDLN